MIGKIKKHFAALWLTICVVFSLAACSSTDTSDQSVQTEEGYIAEFSNLETEGIMWGFGVQQFGGDFCYITRSQNKETGKKSQSLCRYSLTEGNQTSTPFIFLEPEKGQVISKFTIAEDGSIYAVVNVSSGNVNAEGLDESTFFLSKFDSECRQISAVSIEEQIKEDSGSNICGMITDSQGRLYIAGTTLVWLYDQEGNYKGSIPMSVVDGCQISGIGCSKNGKVYVCYGNGENTDSYSLSCIHFDSRKLTDSYKDFPGKVIIPGIEKDFLIQDGCTVYDYDLSSQTAEPVLDWMDHDVVGSSVSYYGALEDGRIYAITWAGTDMEVALLGKTGKDNQAVSKDEIVIAIVGHNGLLESVVADYNKNNEKYHFSIKEYAFENKDSLNIDIVSDHCPDIIVMVNVDAEQLASLGVFEDMNDYLEKSKALNRADFLENLLEACTYDGLLAAVPIGFQLNTWVGNAAELNKVLGGDKDFGEGGCLGWTVEEAIAYANAHPDASLFGGLSKGSVMDIMMEYGYGTYIDWENGKCSFDSDSFKNVLEFVNSYPEDSTNSHGSSLESYQNGEVLLSSAYIMGFDALQLQEEMFQGQVACVGYPSADGSGGCRLTLSEAYAITTKSAHKEGAWEFIESLLVQDKGNSAFSFSAIWSRLDAKANEVTEIVYMLNDDGSIFINQRTGEPVIMNSVRTAKINDWEFTYHVPTQEEVDTIMELIKIARPGPASHSDVVLAIISEEAESYYNGQKTVDEVAGIIQNRIQNYVNENMK